MDATHPGALLRRFRLAAALSQEDLAERSTVSVRTISDLERGIRDTARLETVRLLAAALELSDDDRALLIAAAVQGGAGPTVQPPLEPPGTPLPAPPNPLVGREAMVAEIVRRMVAGNERLLTLIGPGGVGKTRLAIEAAGRISEASGVPAVFVSLAPVTDPAVVPAALAQALGLSPGIAPAESAVAWLRNRRRLLLVDNFEHLLDAAPFIAEIVEACPGVSILATSRARLRLSAERELAVPPLDLPVGGASSDQMASTGAVRLFFERAAEIDGSLPATGETVSLAAEICRRVDGLPLAIELAASKLRVMPPATLLALLEKRLPVLTGGVRDQPVRQQSMRNTIAWSHELLDQRQARLYRWLAVFIGGVSPEAVVWTGEALGFSQAETFEALEGLLDSGLVQRMPGWEKSPRYRMLETIREYGLEQLEAAGELESARLSHARYIASYAAEGAPLPSATVLPDWHHRLRDEDANLVAAFDYACDAGPLDLCLEYMSLAGAYWDYWGPYKPGSARLLKALERVPQEPSLTTISALYWTAAVTMYAGDYDRANQLGKSALEMARHLGDRRLEAAALSIMGWNAEISEQWDEASDFFEQALALWTELGDVGAQGQIFMLLGGHAYVRGDLAEARRLEEQAHSILSDFGYDWAAGTIWYLGFIDVAEGKLRDAARHYQRSLELWIDSNSKTHHFKPIIHLADVAAELGAFETAATLAGCCDALLENSGSTLFPFDVPAWERATSRSRAALGDERFEALHRAGQLLGPDDWLRLAGEVVERAG